MFNYVYVSACLFPFSLYLFYLHVVAFVID